MHRIPLSLLAFISFLPAARAEQEAVVETEAESEDRPHFGFEISAGLPDGFTLSLVGRPWTWLELHAGGAYNVVSFGIQGGITLAPFDYAIRPLLTIEGGHYFPGDANKLAAKFSEGFNSPLFDKLSYSWASLQLGLDLGIDQFRFFIRGGMSYVRSPMIVEALDSRAVLTGFMPCAKLGFSSILF